MNFHEKLEAALKEEDPVLAVRRVAQGLFDQGLDQAMIVEMFERARQPLQQANREGDEDVLLDVMDFITGWCSPHMKLPDAFIWTYPLYYLVQGIGCVSLGGKSGDAVAVFTERDFAERFLNGNLSQVVSVNSSVELSDFLRRMQLPVSSVAFNPIVIGPQRIRVRVCVPISVLLEKITASIASIPVEGSPEELSPLCA